MIKEAFLVCALAVPSNVIPYPKFARWLSIHDPNVTHLHSNMKTLVINNTDLTILDFLKIYSVRGHEEALPFRDGAFLMVYKETKNLAHATLKEMNRVLEWGGFVALVEEQDLRMRGFNYVKLPFHWNGYHVYQKRGMHRVDSSA